MRRQPFTIVGAALLAGGVLVMAGCGNSQSGQGILPSGSAEGGASEVEVPTPEEAQAAAAEEITPANADEALQDLESEIDRELGNLDEP